jgi:hypothetical protein
VGRQPFIHTPDDFDLSVDEDGIPHFVDTRFLSRFGRRHGGNRAAFCLVLSCQFLVLLITIATGAIVDKLPLSNFMLAFILLVPLSLGLVAILTVVFLYYRRHIAMIITATGTAMLLAIIGGIILLGGAALP